MGKESLGRCIFFEVNGVEYASGTYWLNHAYFDGFVEPAADPMICREAPVPGVPDEYSGFVEYDAKVKRQILRDWWFGPSYIPYHYYSVLLNNAEQDCNLCKEK